MYFHPWVTEVRACVPYFHRRLRTGYQGSPGPPGSQRGSPGSLPTHHRSPKPKNCPPVHRSQNQKHAPEGPSPTSVTCPGGPIPYVRIPTDGSHGLFCYQLEGGPVCGRDHRRCGREPPKMCVKGTDVPQSLMGSVSPPRAIWISESIIYRAGGGPDVRAPATQDDGREQGTARRPDTSGDVPGAEDGGGHGHPKGGGMAKWMEDEQNLSTRRGWHGAKVSQPWPRPEGGSQGDAPGRGESGPSPEAVRGPRAGEKGAAPGGGNRGPPPYGRLRRGRPSI